MATDNPTTAMLDSILNEAGRLAEEAHALLSPVADARDHLRQQLDNNARVIPIAEPQPAWTLAAVDGGCVREHLYAADQMTAIATAATGITSHRQDLPLGHQHWEHVVGHVAENDVLLSAAMASLELQVIAGLRHDIRILDGAHATPLIALIKALYARNDTVAATAAALCTSDVVAAVAALANPALLAHPGEIIALPKADSSHRFSDQYRDRYGLDLPGGDRFIAAQVLKPGEMLYPRPVPLGDVVGFTVKPRDDTAPAVKEAINAVTTAIDPLKRAVQEGRLLVTYLKPETADIPIKMEFRADQPLPATPTRDHPTIRHAARLARIVSDETPGPYMQEPYAQYAVDLAAKKVSVAAQALNQAMLAHLPDGSERYITLLSRTYRTATAPALARRR